MGSLFRWQVLAEPEKFETTRKRGGGIIDLQNASTARFRSRGRRMKDKRSVEPDITSLREAGYHFGASHDCVDIALRDNTGAMRAACDQERGIGRRHRIEVNAQRHHARQQLDGRRDMWKTALDRPGAETGHVTSLADDDSAILMPAERPIGRLGLVEQDRPDGKAIEPQRRGRNGADRAFRIQQARQFGTPLQPDTGPLAR
jgi:hypothetical protein